MWSGGDHDKCGSSIHRSGNKSIVLQPMQGGGKFKKLVMTGHDYEVCSHFNLEFLDRSKGSANTFIPCLHSFLPICESH